MKINAVTARNLLLSAIALNSALAAAGPVPDCELPIVVGTSNPYRHNIGLNSAFPFVEVRTPATFGVHGLDLYSISAFPLDGPGLLGDPFTLNGVFWRIYMASGSYLVQIELGTILNLDLEAGPSIDLSPPGCSEGFELTRPVLHLPEVATPEFLQVYPNGLVYAGTRYPSACTVFNRDNEVHAFGTDSLVNSWIFNETETLDVDGIYGLTLDPVLNLLLATTERGF